MHARAYPGPRINWDRLGRVILVIVLFAVFVSYLNPQANFVHTWRDSRASKEKLTELRQENTSLKRKSAALSNPAVLVRQARKQGMVRVGEHPYVIHDLPH
jgi:cell division protein FtsB